MSNQESVNAADLLSGENIIKTDAITTKYCVFTSTRGEIFYMLYTGGSAKYVIEVNALLDRWDKIAEGTLEDDKLAVVDIDFYLPKARVIIYPNAGNSFSPENQCWVSTYGYPAVFVRK